MYGDTSTIRARASALRAAADALRSRASAAGTRSEACLWSSAAGELLRSAVRSTTVELVRQARHLEDAADALDAHIRAVDRTLAEVAGAAQAGRGAGLPAAVLR